MAQGINQLKTLTAPIGLKLNLSKCELIPTSLGSDSIDWELFDESIPKNLEEGFQFLGVPIGKAEFCQSFTSERAAKVQESLDAIGELPDPQVALALLRSCASFGKMLFAARSTPFDVHQDQLSQFDKAVRVSFQQFTGLRPDETQWLQATFATKKGGLGLRNVSTPQWAGGGFFPQ